MADKFLAPGKIARLRSGVIDFVEKFLKYRKPPKFDKIRRNSPELRVAG